MQQATDIAIGVIAILLALAAVFVVPALAKSRQAKRVTVNDFEAALLVRKGRVERTLGPGQYSTWLTDDQILRYDMRETTLHVAGQEVLTKDLLPVRLTLVGRYRIADAAIYRSSHPNPSSRVHEEAQLELRRRVSVLALDELMEARDVLMEGFMQAVAPAAKEVGMEVTAIDLRDLTLTGPARQAFADIWKAQKDAQAALERARGEQASLRSLANAARMLKGNPELMNLRLLQALAGGPGKPAPTVVLGGAGGLLPVSASVPAAEGGSET
jgi:regulator of protease activity HflC (stomatin/prohibitin superfamily)